MAKDEGDEDTEAGRAAGRLVREARLVRFDDADALAVLAERFELDRARDFGKERIVLSAAHVLAGVDSGTALANDDRSGGDELAGEALHAQSLTVTVAPILGTAYTFFMCHYENSLKRDCLK